VCSGSDSGGVGFSELVGGDHRGARLAAGTWWDDMWLTRSTHSLMSFTVTAAQGQWKLRGGQCRV
jgi:hypothetical protein